MRIEKGATPMDFLGWPAPSLLPLLILSAISAVNPSSLESRISDQIDHGDRYGRDRIALALSSPTIRSNTGSHWSLRPSRMAMLPRWQTVALRWPMATSAMGNLRVLMQSRKFAW